MINVDSQRDSQFINVQNRLIIIDDDDVRFEVGYAQLHKSAGIVPSPVASQTGRSLNTLNFFHNEIDQMVVSPCVTLCCEHWVAAVQIVICCALVPT